MWLLLPPGSGCPGPAACRGTRAACPSGCGHGCREGQAARVPQPAPFRATLTSLLCTHVGLGWGGTIACTPETGAGT